MRRQRGEVPLPQVAYLLTLSHLTQMPNSLCSCFGPLLCTPVLIVMLVTGDKEETS